MAIPTAVEARAALAAFDITKSALASFVESRIADMLRSGIASVTLSPGDVTPTPSPEHVQAGCAALAAIGYQVVLNPDGSVTISVP